MSDFTGSQLLLDENNNEPFAHYLRRYEPAALLSLDYPKDLTSANRHSIVTIPSTIEGLSLAQKTTLMWLIELAAERQCQSHA